MPTQLLKLLTSVATEFTDAVLLDRFVTTRDEAAFAELVRRHGPAVYRVCRRLTDNSSADDAFQATFLVLACRADRVRKAGSVGSWLIGVAGRVARQMRKRSLCRAASDLSLETVADASCPAPEVALHIPELAAALDDELTRLPESLRDPIVLCLVNGRTHEQAAAELGGSPRTLRRRLERAKSLLRLRLERRGIVPAVAVGLVASVGAVSAVPVELARRTVREVVEFLTGRGVSSPAALVAKGVLGHMASAKLSVLASAAAVVLLGLGLGLAADQPLPVPSAANVPLAGPLVPPREDPELIPPPPAVREVEPPRDANPHRTANFIVHAPTPTMARAIAAEAEHQRAGLAKQWLGKELPPAEKPHVIRFTQRDGAAGGTTTFTFAEKGAAKPGVLSASTDLHGDFLSVLTNHLPHETMHVVLASHFGRPLPRWADEGIAVAAEDAKSQQDHDARCRELLNAGRCIRLRVLLRMTEYPRDMIVLYAQGHSVTRFLLSQQVTVGPPVLSEVPYLKGLFKNVANPHQQLIVFLHIGMNGNTAESWDKAAKTAYGFESVDAMEEAWLKTLKTPPVPRAGTSEAPKPEKSALIPPPVVPAGGR